ncbi:TPA: AAA family ATPase, partial [archaeon]|nr:AAA family ATPase [Candidatus Naiadarchaeales archaeon SRR2090153.bin461]
MKTFITSLHLNGFKSFGRKVSLDFSPGLNAVIGPNGSGKSNTLDALCFILGRMSSKDLRAENFSDLIFKRKTQTAGEAETSIVLDNSGGVFPFTAKSVEVRRRIKKDGTTQYKINGKNATRQELLELLSLVRVHPEGHNIILQGDIEHFVGMKPIEKRQLVEEIAGIGVYEERKFKALSELSKVDDKLKESQIVLSEKENYMKNLEEEKRGAEQHRSMKAELAAAQAAEIKLRMDSANAKKNKVLAEIEKRENNISGFKLELEIAQKKIHQLKEKVLHLEKEIEKKGGEDARTLQKQLDETRLSAEKLRISIANSGTQIKDIENRKNGLEKNLSDLGNKIKEKEKERAELEKQRQKILDAEESGKDADSSELESLDEKAAALDRELGKLNGELLGLKDTKAKLSAELTIIEHELASAEEKLAELDKFDSRKIEKRYKELGEEINKQASHDSKLALELGELKKEQIKKEEELLKTKAQSSVQDILLRDRAIKELFSQKKKIPGILGTVAELGKVDKEYAAALSVAAGNRMKYIVVDGSDTAIKCLQVLKNAKAGIATFLPLDKLVVDEPADAPTRPGVIGLASDLITCESKYKKIFRYIFRNTLVVDDMQTAKSLGTGKYRMVTVEGDLFEQSGAITGGFREKGIGLSFEKNEFRGMLVKLESDLQLISKNISEAEKKRTEISENIYGLRKEKSELEGRAELTKGFDKNAEALEKKISELKKKKSGIESETHGAGKECERLESEIKEKAGRLNSMKLKLFGSGKKELQEILARKSEVESQLAAAIATLENALLPEKE